MQVADRSRRSEISVPPTMLQCMSLLLAQRRHRITAELSP